MAPRGSRSKVDGDTERDTPEESSTGADQLVGQPEDHLSETARLGILTKYLDRAQVELLRAPTPPERIKHRQGFDYVSQSYVTDRLNEAFGYLWNFRIAEWKQLEEEVVVIGSLEIVLPDKGIVMEKQQFGGAQIKRFSSGARSGQAISVADDFKAAASDALKKCSTLLGIALDLYERDKEVQPMQRGGWQADRQAPRPATPRPAPPAPTGNSEQIRGQINTLLSGMEERPRGELVRSLFPRNVPNLNALTDEERVQVLEGVKARVQNSATELPVA